MAGNALVQTRIDPKIRDKATEVLAKSGLTVSDAVRILLTRTANEGALPMELLTPDEAYDAWFRAKVQEALDDPRPDISGEEVQAEFAERRARLRARIGGGER
ncbi:type II toxin-antitoxin system RelB/DinJ family antitoxin [Devosia sp.]|uniref:type II toxin-antitoxin system RelB/DinJ family antitoxin n=1 Tax=Devosia sp. TaxID=1871048 RepID=UPI0035B3AC9B